MAEKLWGPDDPLFPTTFVSPGDERRFEVKGLAREHWRTTTPIRRVFREAFALAEMPCSNRHSFRKTLALLGEKLCRTPEEFKAWSQNLGHERVMTTFSSYGNVANSRQAETMRDLAVPKDKEQGSVEAALKLIRLAKNS